MKTRFPLQSRIFAVLSTLVSITIIGALVMIWYTYRMENLLATIIEKNLSAFQSAEALEIALVNQKGFVTYFFQDANPDWLRQLGEHRRLFSTRFQNARARADSGIQQEMLDRIEQEYKNYTSGKDKVIDLYKQGRRQEGEALHRSVRRHFFAVLELCEAYKETHTQLILEMKRQSQDQAARLRLVALGAIIASLVMAMLLAVILVAQVLGPMSRLFALASRDAKVRPSANVVAALSQKVHGLLEDMDQTHLELAKSRESLLQAEKMVMVGKLAAGMAHSIRNPFTSVQMRLFSLNRSLKLNDEQREDLDVITEEIRHIDTIVQNFLEFSRPPKLKMQPLSPSMVVDTALKLLHHRLKSYDVTITLERMGELPHVAADPEQLKEVLVNLIINACEAMEKGGHITITEKIATRGATRMAVLRVSDDGPGIAESNLDKVFQPFYTTKEEGTGLGLSIVDRIIREHGGSIQLESEVNKGAVFTIYLPITDPFRKEK